MRDVIESWEVQQDGITYRVELEPDYDSSTDDSDCYSPSDVEAFKRGDWQYVGVIVTPLIDGPDVTQQYAGTVHASLWAVEYGTMPAETEPWQGGQHGETVIDRASIERYPVPDLICEARAELAKLRDSLAGLALDDCEAVHPDHPGIANAHCSRAAGHETPHRADFGEWSDESHSALMRDAHGVWHCQCGQTFADHAALAEHVTES